jgi:hypothetical protein
MGILWPGAAINFETDLWVIDTLVLYEDKAIVAGQHHGILFKFNDYFAGRINV